MKNEDFRYTKVTVERPLKLRYELNDETRSIVLTRKPLSKLEPSSRAAFVEEVENDVDWTTFDREQAQSKVAEWLTPLGKVAKPLRDALLAAVSVPDEAGEIVRLAKGDPKPNVALRDFVYVPNDVNIDSFVAQHVLPFAPDAWTNRESDKIGYAVPFTRSFFHYVPLRSVAAIDEDIQVSQGRLLKLLEEANPQ
jgi:type I restriction enzyme M protein